MPTKESKKESSEFITQGMIQLKMVDGKEDVTAWINPVSDYTVKHQGKEYIVFISEKFSAPNDRVLVYEKDQPFSLSKDFVEWCDCDNTKIEIGINAPDFSAPKIISLKIPASFKPCA